MKIAMIGQKGIPSRAGGIEVHVEEISQRLVQLGCNIEVYCRKGFCEREYKACYKGIRLVYTPFFRFKYLDTITHSFISTIKALLSNCDVFHYHALGPATLSFIPRLFRKKVVCTVHGLDWQRGKWGILASLYLRFGEVATAKFPNKTINVSENLVEYYKRKHHCDTVYIPNGAEPVEYAPPDIITEKYGLRKEEYILFLARLVPEKGAHYLIDAYNKLQTTKKLVIAGCSCNTDVYVKSLHDKARDNTNILFTGFVSGQTLQELYSNAFLYVCPLMLKACRLVFWKQ